MVFVWRLKIIYSCWPWQFQMSGLRKVGIYSCVSRGGVIFCSLFLFLIIAFIDVCIDFVGFVVRKLCALQECLFAKHRLVPIQFKLFWSFLCCTTACKKSTKTTSMDDEETKNFFKPIDNSFLVRVRNFLNIKVQLAIHYTTQIVRF